MTALEPTSRSGSRRSSMRKPAGVPAEMQKILSAEGAARALLLRILREISARVMHASKAAVETAVAEQSDRAALWAFLRATSLEGQKEDPLQKARIKGLERMSGVLQYGGSSPLKADQVAELLGVSRQSVNTWRQEGRILGLPQARRGFIYPAWQFDRERRRVVRGLRDVLSVIDATDPWSVLLFFTSPNSALEGQVPIDVLKASDDGSSRSRVIRAAELWRRHGAP